MMMNAASNVSLIHFCSYLISASRLSFLSLNSLGPRASCGDGSSPIDHAPALSESYM